MRSEVREGRLYVHNLAQKPVDQRSQPEGWVVDGERCSCHRKNECPHVPKHVLPVGVIAFVAEPTMEAPDVSGQGAKLRMAHPNLADLSRGCCRVEEVRTREIDCVHGEISMRYAVISIPSGRSVEATSHPAIRFVMYSSFMTSAASTACGSDRSKMSSDG